MSEKQRHQSSLGVVLAGGLSRRMEGPEKSLMALCGKPMAQRACARFCRQIDDIIINANGDPVRFDFLGKPVQSDTVEGFAGPLAGILAAMVWAKQHRSNCQRIITIPADTPFFPDDLVEKFENAISAFSDEEREKTICLAFSDGNRHPVFGNWPIALLEALEHFLVAENERKVMMFVQRYNLVKVDFPMGHFNGNPLDPFFNINTPDDMKLAEKIFENFTHE